MASAAAAAACPAQQLSDSDLEVSDQEASLLRPWHAEAATKPGRPGRCLGVSAGVSVVSAALALAILLLGSKSARPGPIGNYQRFDATGHEILSLDEDPAPLEGGADCLEACGGRAGMCPRCGPRRACCRRDGVAAEVLECAGAAGFSSDHHECVDGALPDGIVAQATVETPAYQGDDDVDVDDAAVWEADNPGSSLVLGTLKLGGLDLYNLQGELLDHLDAPTGSRDGVRSRLNNVGVLGGNGLVVVSDRGWDQLRFYRVHQDGDGASLEDVTADDTPLIFSDDTSQLHHTWTAYGLTVATLSDGHGYAFVTRHWQPDVAKVRIRSAADGKMTYEVVGRLQLPQQFNNSFTGGEVWDACSPCNDTAMGAEGMVVDPASGRLFIAQEWLGLYAADAEDFRSESLKLIDVSDVFGRPYDRVWKPDWGIYDCQFQGRTEEANIRKDAEGLSLYARGHHGQGYLVLSSQGADRYELYARQEPFGHLGSFKIELDDHQIHHTDGVEVSGSSLGSHYPKGIVIVQDQATHSSTNFKFLSWAALEGAIADAGL